jgi:hypothetical protein
VTRTTLRLATLGLLLFAAHARPNAQTRPADAPRPTPQTQAAPSSSADEEFDLNIDVRRINEGDFRAETAVSTGAARGLQLKVGVALRASDIDVLLRDVRGHVRFRASLETVLRLLESRRDPAPSDSPAPAPSPP